PKDKDKGPLIKAQTFTGPRSPVNVQALPEMGAVVISAQNAADMELVLAIIRYLQQEGAVSNVEIRLVKIEHQDPTSLANVLSTLFTRVVVPAAGNTRSMAPTVTTTTPFGGQITQQQFSSVVLLPVPRLNSLFVAAPVVRMKDILARIKELDVPDNSDKVK